MKFLCRVDGFLNRIEGALLITFLTVMVLMAFLQVVLRNVFSEGILWADILLRHLVLWVGFLGAALAASQERHISIDAFARMMTPRVRAGIRAVTNLFTIVVCYLLFDAALTFVQFEIEDQRELFSGIPEWYSEIIIPVGFSLLIIHFAVRMIVAIHEAVRGGKG